jgi:hypothetical protein
MCLKAFGERSQSGEVGIASRGGRIGPASEQGEATIAFRARDDVNVDMRNLLARNRPIMNADGEVGRLEFGGQSPLDFSQAIHQGMATLFGQVSDALRLLLGNDQSMARAAWEYIEKCVPQIAFSNL